MSSEALLGFSGDVGFYGAFDAKRAPEEVVHPAVSDFLRGNQYNVFNVEGPVTERTTRPDIGPTLSSRPAVALPILRHLACNVANLANNHTMDCGPGGLTDTLSLLQTEKIRTLGAGRTLEEAGRPVMLEAAGFRIGLLAVCDRTGSRAGVASPGVLIDRPRRAIVERLAALREQCDWVVLNFHGGEEYTSFPMPARRRLLLRYLDHGADIVVAHHAHVVQGWEVTSQGIVFYGLGNFILDHPTMARRPAAYSGMLLRLAFGADEVRFDPFFTRSDPVTGRIEPGAALPQFAPIPERGRRVIWCREANRTRSLRKAAISATSDPSSPPASRGAGAIGRVRTLIRLTRQWNYRPVILGDLEHRARVALRLQPAEGVTSTEQIPVSADGGIWRRHAERRGAQ